MRLLYLAADPVPFPKGAGVRIRRTVEGLVQLGHRVSLLSLPGLDGGRLRSPGISHQAAEPAAGNALERLVSFRRQAEAWLGQRRGELVQVRSIWEGIPAAAWAKRAGATLVLEAHGFPSLEMPGHHPELYQQPRLLEKLVLEEQALLRAADRVLTPSLTGRRFLVARGVDRRRIAVVPNVVDTGLFTPPAPPPPDERPLRLVYTGTLAPWQGLGALLEALARFRKGGEVELHVVGPQKGVWRRQLRARARAARVHHMVHLSGATAQQDLVPVLQRAHICVAPMPLDPRNAVQGCCPLKVLEYMSCGRPILATRIPPLLELLSHGRTAHLVGTTGPADLAAGIAWMLDNPGEREALGARARRAALKGYAGARFVPWLEEGLRGLPP